MGFWVYCVYGALTDEGLAAMSECQDITTALARELTLGIKNEVEDLSAIFKKMAILKPLNESSDMPIDNEVIDNEVTSDLPIHIEPIVNTHVIEPFTLLAKTNNARQARTAKTKPIAAYEGQISLFDFLSQTV